MNGAGFFRGFYAAGVYWDNPDGTIYHEGVYEHKGEGAKKSTDERRKRTRELLKMVGLSEREEHKPHRLSAGEQQRIGIARALANSPP